MIGEFDRSDASNIPAHEQNLAGARFKQPGEQIDQRGLSGAVGPHDRHQFAGMHAHVDLIERAEGAVEFADLAGLEQQGHATHPAIVRRRSAANPADSPAAGDSRRGWRAPG